MRLFNSQADQCNPSTLTSSLDCMRKISMSPELRWFTVRLALVGVSPGLAAETVQDIQDELKMRPYLRNPRVFWETGTHKAIVQVDSEDLKSELAAEQMAEELLEVASAILKEFDTVHVDILSAYPSPL